MSDTLDTAGAQALALLAIPLNCLVVDALSAGPKRLVDLRRAVGSPSQSTLRLRLRGLEEVGVVAKRRQNEFPGALEYELEEAGRDLGLVAATVNRWLAAAPHGPFELGSEPAKGAIKALVEGWSTTMLRALAAKPRSLTELARIIPALSYPSLERRLETMRMAELLKAVTGSRRGTPHVVTGWLRQAVAPLAAATHWEHRNVPDRVAISGLDVEAALLLVAPTLTLPDEMSGSCRMVVDISNGSKRELAGATIRMADGRVESYVPHLRDKPDAWAAGSPADWFSAVIDDDGSGLELGGDRQLAHAVLDRLHGTLFDTEPAKTRQVFERIN